MATQPICATNVCTKCGVEKPFTLEFFGHGAAGNLRRKCRACRLARISELRIQLKASDIEKQRARDRKMRESQDKDKRRASARKHRAENPEKYKAYAKTSYLKNADVIREKERARRKLIPREVLRARHMAWRASAPDKVEAIKRRWNEKVKTDPDLRAKAAENQRRWRANNPMAASAAQDRRRALELNAPGEWTRDDVREILKSQGRFCFYCQCRLTKFQCDHFIPLSRGGSNGPENIVLSCGPCNFSKGAKMPWEWKPDRFSPEFRPRQ